MELQELEKDLLKENGWLFHKLGEQKDLIKKWGRAEHDYRVALADKLLEYRIAGEPATIMGDLCRGDRAIAKLKLERDISKGIADACRQSIIATQASMSALQTLISTRKEEMKLL